MTLPGYEPMLAVPWTEPFSDPDWWFEVKWDGVRLLLFWDGERVTLRTRRGRDASATYPELAGFAAAVPCVLDGEVVALDDAGLPSFERLQSRMNVSRPSPELVAAYPLSMVVFDILHHDEPLVGLPIERRRSRLGSLDLPQPFTSIDVVAGDGLDLWAAVAARGLEGMVAKRRGSSYRPGLRSADWRKVANRRRIRAVVAGFTPGEGGRADSFGALLVGLWTGEGLRWCGQVGSGFDDASLGLIRAALDEQIVDGSPFLPDEALTRDAVFVEPTLVAWVEFKEWTSAGRLRAPVFKGFARDDPATITWEAEGPGE